VPDLSDIERDHDGSFIVNDVEDKGVRCVHSGIVRFIDSQATLGQFVAGANSREAVFRDGRPAAIFLDHEQEVTLPECITSKAAVAQIRARLAASAPPPACALRQRL
jgi:hypothetical protein